MRSPKVLGVLAGRDLAPGALEAWLAWADLVVAADGGADLCRETGREPDVIVGDLDSISDPTGLTPDPDQDSSDADKLLAYLTENGISAVTLIGVEGDRLDHVLSTLFSCTRQPGITCDLVLRRGSAKICNQGGTLTEAAQGRISVIPLERSIVTLTGTRWPLENAIIEPRGLVSLSNEMAEDHLTLTTHQGATALFLKSGALPNP